MASIMADDDMESFVVLGTSPPDSYNSFSMQYKSSDQNPQSSLQMSPASSLKADGNTLIKSALYEPLTEPVSIVSTKGPSSLKTDSLTNGTSPGSSGCAVNNINSMSFSKIDFKNDETSMISSFAADVILGKMGPKPVQEFSLIKDNETELTDVKTMAATIEKLKDVIRNTNIVMRQHYAKMEEYQAEVNKEKLLINEEFRRRGADFENAMQEKQKLKEEIVSANETVIKEREECDAKLEDYKKVIEQNSVIIEKLKANNNVALQNEIAEIKEEFDLNISIMKKENFDLTKDLSERRSIIKNMTAEIERLQKLNGHQFQQPIDKEPKILQKEHRDIVTALEDKMTVQQIELNKMKAKYVEEIQCREVNLTDYRERLENLSMDLERTKAANLNLQEQINLASTQMEVYKTDFMMERQARQEIAAEKELILTDLKMLQRRNQVLTESSRAADQSQPTSIPAGPSAPTAPQVYQSPNGHVCPLCSRSFDGLPQLEAHVQLCLDQ